MSSLNKAQLIGNLGAKPEVKYTPSGTAVAELRIATSERYTDKSGEKVEKTEWHRVVVWDKLAENCAKYLDKGRSVYVEGKIQTRKWQDKEGTDRYTTEIVAHDVKFLGGGGEKQQGGGGESSNGSYAKKPPGKPPAQRASHDEPQDDFGGGSDDEIPF